MDDALSSPAKRIPNISGLGADWNSDDTKTDSPEPHHWVERARGGDRQAFGELYKLYRPAIFRLVRASLGRDAEDAVAETFVRAWAGLPRYRKTGAPFVSWLYGIARHVVVDTLRVRGRTEAWDELSETSEIVAGGADLDPAAGGADLDLAAALARLPKRQRQIIEMKYLMDLANPEVARALGISIGAVNAKQWRALRALEKMLEQS